jgi:hypothetical protein
MTAETLPRLARLVEPHVRDLAASGLSPETMIAAGLYSAPKAQVSGILGYGVGTGGLVFPYPSVNGEPEYARVKLDEADAQGKRYRSPRAKGNRLYVPPLFDRKALTDIATSLWLTEGEKKALRACQDGLPCLALPGVWSWRTRNERDKSVPVPDLDHVLWRGRTVYIVFDSDFALKPSVRLAEFALAKELRGRGARVRAVRLPSGPRGEKVGLDDYLLNHSIDALCALKPVEIQDPATAAGDPVYVRHGDDHAISWPLHRVEVQMASLREHSDGVSAEIAVSIGGEETHWSKVNLASTPGREALVKKLAMGAPKIP